ncbi:MAG: exo-alpha-sialidase, partial [Cyclobacteriaceae bacterium]|nr:exo-alpha-sialidase [Cyclobacteriaceae bacterium]
MRGISLKSILNLLTIALLLIGCTVKNENKGPGKEITLRLEPKQGNPRNSEGDFIQLKDGRILFVYTHFTGGTGDHASAYLAGRFSNDGGETWTNEDISILP